MARAIGRPSDIVSAGFCHKQPDGKLACYGESVSLGIKSGENDTRDLNISME